MLVAFVENSTKALFEWRAERIIAGARSSHIRHFSRFEIRRAVTAMPRLARVPLEVTRRREGSGRERRPATRR